MKKYLIILLVIMLSFEAKAQMTDALGSLIIDGALTSSELEGVGQMQKSLSHVQVQQGLAELNAEIQTSYFGNYNGLSKSNLDFTGFKGIEWDVGAAADGGYYVELSGIDSALCYYVKLNTGAKRSEIIGKNDCHGPDNTIRLFY